MKLQSGLDLHTNQKLRLTPHLQQAIQLLSLSAIELQSIIQENLEKNPLLELEETTAPEKDSITQRNSIITPEDAAIRTSHEELNDSTAHACGHEREHEREIDIPQNEQLPIDTIWEDVYPTTAIASNSSQPSEENFEDFRSEPDTLKDYLMWQLELTPFSPQDQNIAVAIIDALDHQGFLRLSVEEVLATMPHIQNTKLQDIEVVLHRIQQFDPPGIAARHLAECMLIQLKQYPIATPWLEETTLIVSEYLEDLANQNHKKIMKSLHLSPEDLTAVIKLMNQLNPRPGYTYDMREPEYIIPDVYVKKVDGRWQVRLNEELNVNLKLSNNYDDSKITSGPATQLYIKQQLQEAKWFLKSLQSRNTTLLKVTSSIVEYQQAFLEEGEIAMRPLVLHEIAAATELHESTISRITTGKYVHTPRGIFELKYFFCSHVTTAGGEGRSSTAIQATIREIISKENRQRPLSDHFIALQLKKQGINIARRTVTKYREQLGILPSNERRNILPQM